MTYDKQDLLLDLRKIAKRGADDPEVDHAEADAALIRYITAAYEAISKWYA